ncbi:Tyrosine phosphatase family protein [Phycisphaerae bacterium RAS1]|nr:Tyrosine phosphatase family protein [Phycisphaerae bacterium RAS1]
MIGRRRKLLVLAGAGVVLIAGGLAWAVSSRTLPRRFSSVVEGQLYRSGSVSPEQLRIVHERYGIRRVLCLLSAAASETIAEREAAEKLGLTWINIPLTGDGASTPEQREQILAALADVDRVPTLVHCAAGVNRTGLAVGLYRLRYSGWTLEQALAELKSRGFEDQPHHQNLRDALAEAAASPVR